MDGKCAGEMTRKEFESLPCREWNEDIGPFDSLIILPTRRKHDSGYRCMDFVIADPAVSSFCLHVRKSP